MTPTFVSGEKVLAISYHFLFKKPRVGEIVIVKLSKERKSFLKRIVKIKQNTYFVLGDNKKESTDSRSFGWIKKESIKGKVFYKL